jgi:hypothetical protein
MDHDAAFERQDINDIAAAAVIIPFFTVVYTLCLTAVKLFIAMNPMPVTVTALFLSGGLSTFYQHFFFCISVTKKVVTVTKSETFTIYP